VTGIHLDGDYLRQQHELVLPGHDCPALDHFESHISDLRIGNPDDLQNKINYYQQVIKVLSQYKEGVKALMKVDPSNLSHFQAVQRQVTQQHGHHQPVTNHHHQQHHQSPNGMQSRFQRHLSPNRLPLQTVVGVNGSTNGHVQPQTVGVQQHPQHRVQTMTIPSGLPNRPSSYYGNQNYYGHGQQPQPQQQSLSQRSYVAQQQGNGMFCGGASRGSSYQIGCASNAAANAYRMN